MRKVLLAAVLAIGVVGVTGGGAARAQTGPDLLLKPLLSEQEFLESRGGALLFPSGSATGGNDYQQQIFQLQGRVREERENFIPRLGWDLNFYHLRSDIAVLDQDLTDVSLAAGFELWNEGNWRAGFTAGIGYAGSAPFARSDAWYGKATLLIARKLDENTDLGFVVDYDGNRSIFSDFPLPGFAYRHTYDPTLSYTIGAPVSSVTWKPAQFENFSLDATWVIPDTFTARAAYKLSPKWTAYASWEHQFQSFHVDQLHGNDRLLFEQRRVELGVQWHPWEHTALTAAAGYAWGGQWSAGFSQRHSDLIADVSDEPYFRIGFERRF
jgi:hypothetical protein